MFRKILIANRGEIACRIARTCRRLGINVATVHSAADRGALHVREIGESIEIGAAPARESYLVIERIIEAAQTVGADAVHPGYGFLAENGDFAEALADHGITFIGPSPQVLRNFGDKARAKQLARRAGIPVVPGTDEPSTSVDTIAAAIAKMTLPVLLKAVAGGGGKGMRLVADAATAQAEIAAAMRESKSSFGDARLIVERFLSHARHIEVQILGDGQGNVIHLFDRECSLQRRHQKVIEEAPVHSLIPSLRAEILAHAVRLGAEACYAGLGTVEFIVKDGSAFFLEVNPRIQVEHPTTELVTSLDLVELQIRAVAEGRLPLSQADVAIAGAAVEARLYAEDPDNGFLPATGTIIKLHLTDMVRVDAGVAAGTPITPFYDPMIAKLIALGTTRDEAYSRLAVALHQCCIEGARTNLSFLHRVVAEPAVRSNEVDTGTIDAMMAAKGTTSRHPLEVHIAAGLWLRAQKDRIWCGREGMSAWRLSTGEADTATAPALRLVASGRNHEVRFGHTRGQDELMVSVDGDIRRLRFYAHENGVITVWCDELAVAATPVLSRAFAGFASSVASASFEVQPYLSDTLLSQPGRGDGRVRAPMMGSIVSVHAEQGQLISTGDVLAIMESMKMELRIVAPLAGRVTDIDCQVGRTVARDQLLFVLTPQLEQVP